ncbi:type IV secretory system conjugative DNA transfer family protein [Rhizobium sp. DKSPLA3]|uniref:Type IV secretory system conjugative DNA transfer family protein n=1 Tax=Rhizobium quercicola TaxID=2901226 RepID=A0A9X1T9F4_9HYPH|nr:type IV secretory system conjugative DNA transfer family protein [Rhizobium quercicola]MCD7111823.1 type IV secretory system conjugative DNA transfer family protein [Rhizobium quercicola]
MFFLKGFFTTLRWLFRGLWWVVAKLFGGPLRKGSHGSARWARRWEQWWHGAISGEGVLLGRGAFRKMIRFSTDGLVMVFASTGAGKGLGVVIPSLLTYRGSMVVTDPKGENYAITRRHRSSFGKVRMLNPSDIARSDRWNPMDIIRAEHAADDAAALAALMVKPDARESHWDDKAASFLTALILHVMAEAPADRTLATVRKLSVGGRETFIETMKEIATSSQSVVAQEVASGAMASAIDSEGNFSPEFQSILSNLQKATEPWSRGKPAGRLSAQSTFQLSELTDGISTLYLCVDEEFLDIYDRWLRVMVGCILKTMTRAKARRPERKVVLMLDEVAVLGRLETLEKQSGLLRAYCTPVLIWQNLPQVRKVYGEDSAAFLANASARVFFGTNDNDTAEYVARMVGNTTNLSSSQGTSISAGGPASHQQGFSESGYWLLDPAEVQRLPPTKVIVKLRDQPFSILGRRLDYRYTWRWLGLWDQWQASAVQGLNSVPLPPVDDTDDLPQPSFIVHHSRARSQIGSRLP